MRYIGVSASVDSCSSCTLLPELYKWKVWLAFNFFFLKSFLRPKPTCQPGYKRSSRDPEKPVLCSHSQHTICPQGMLLGFVPALAVLPCWGIAGSLQLLDVMEDVFQVLVTADSVMGQWEQEPTEQPGGCFFFFFFACFLNLLRKLTDLPFTGNLWLSAVFVRGSVLQDGLHTSLLPVYLKENTISLEAIRTQKMWNTV